VHRDCKGSNPMQIVVVVIIIIIITTTTTITLTFLPQLY
jgi:hypothetical protein